MPNPEIVLVIPAAGAGTRLQSSTPKVLTPVSGRPMVDYLFDLYRNVVQRFVLVVHPSFEASVRAHCAHAAAGLDVRYATQENPSGMLDAILLGGSAAQGASRVWVTWCDQVGVSAATVSTLLNSSAAESDAQIIFPTARQPRPYIHVVRDPEGRICGILQRREGDDMPPVGETDMGLFSMSSDSYFTWLPRFQREAARSAATGERNFLPFIPWSVERGHRVITFPCLDEIEALGINTPADLQRMEQHLADRRTQ